MSAKKIRVIWNDARLFSPQQKTISLSSMETLGFLEKETDTYLLIKDPITTGRDTGGKHPKQKPTFYYIPKGMIQSIEYITIQ